MGINCSGLVGDEDICMQCLIQGEVDNVTYQKKMAIDAVGEVGSMGRYFCGYISDYAEKD